MLIFCYLFVFFWCHFDKVLDEIHYVSYHPYVKSCLYICNMYVSMKEAMYQFIYDYSIGYVLHIYTFCIMLIFVTKMIFPKVYLPCAKCKIICSKLLLLRKLMLISRLTCVILLHIMNLCMYMYSHSFQTDFIVVCHRDDLQFCLNTCCHCLDPGNIPRLALHTCIDLHMNG